MKVSIIIPTLNEEKNIRNLLKDIYLQDVDAEVIVVDGKSSDKTVAYSRKFKQVKVFVTHRGVAHQRNYGALKAHNDLLVFLDADVRLPKHFLTHTIQEVQQRKLDICCPFYLPFESTLFIQLIYIFFNAMFFLTQLITPSGAGSCIMCKTDIFKLGYGFDKRLKYDDIEMIRRYSRIFRFRMLFSHIYVSDRRFKKEGLLLFLKYLILSLFFLTGKFKQANAVPYEFGKYE